MKVIVTKQYEFDDEDRRLLSIELPDNPCNKCPTGTSAGCCGCPDYTKYIEIIKHYRERNIYDLALKINHMHKLQKDIENIQKEIDSLAKEIEETGILN